MQKKFQGFFFTLKTISYSVSQILIEPTPVPSTMADAGGTAAASSSVAANRKRTADNSAGPSASRWSSAVLREALSFGIALGSSAFNLEMVSLLEKLPFRNCLQN